MESPSPRRKRKTSEELEVRRKEEEQERKLAVANAKPKKAPPKLQKVVPAEKKVAPPQPSPILTQINNRINDFLDLMASTKKPVNFEDLAFAALEKRLGKPLPPEGDFSKFCSPRSIKEAMKLAELLDEAEHIGNPHLLERWGVV